MNSTPKIRAILVDDEESARDVLQNLLLRFCPEIELIAKCENVEKAVEVIKLEQPDLVFLDIEMPNYAGYEIVDFFDAIHFEIIFITAYDHYAIRAFEISATDYLLKPIDIERLKMAISKVKARSEIKHALERFQLLSTSLQSKEVKNILILEKGTQQIVKADSIIAIEAQESYCYVYTTEKKFTVSKNLKHFETIFEENPDFLRIHRSWMIAKSHICQYSSVDLNIHLTNGVIAKLSKYKKTDFEKAITE